MKKLFKCVWLMALMLSVQTVAQAAVWSVSPWTNDASTGLSSAKSYTHAINNNSTSDGTVVVNGVVFTNTNNSGSVAAGWELPGGLWATESSANINGDSAGLAMNTRFHYNLNSMVLYGLIPGEMYEISLFSVAWENGTRNVTLTQNGASYLFDQDMYGNDNGIIIKGVYEANASGELRLGLNTSFHVYAFANCLYTGELPVQVSMVSPADRVNGVRVSVDTVLEWKEELDGSMASPRFDVYFDPNQLKVEALDPAVKVSSEQTTYSYDPTLEPGTIYYWRIATYTRPDQTEPNQITTVRAFETLFTDEHWSDASWTDDSNSEISVGKYYTHKVNFNASEATTTYVNGVHFENDNNRSGANWTMTGAGGGTGGSHHVTGDGAALVQNMIYGHPAELKLTGLTPGTDYVLIKYTRGWGNPGGRRVAMATSVDGRSWVIDGNHDGDGNGHIFRYSYTAPASGELILTFNPLSTGDSWHHYAFTNEVATTAYIDPSVLPGANVDASVELSWALKGTVSNPTYNLKVATDSTMTNLVVNQSNLSVTSVTPYLTSNTSYYWQVEIVSAGSVIYTSPVWNFITTPPANATKVIEWKFDETAGILAEQTGPTEDADGILTGFNDSATFGVSHVPGLVGNALRLNGIDEYVDVSNAWVYMPTASGQNFAISGYICTLGEYGPLFSMRNSESEDPIIDICLGANGVSDLPGRICMIVRDNTGSSSSTNSVVTINDGRWHNFIVTRLGGKWTLYVDGIARGVINGAATGEVSLDMMGIGASLRWLVDGWNPDRQYYLFLNGMVDEYTIWSGQMQPAQIAELAAQVPAKGDITNDLTVDMDDIAVLSDNWLANTAVEIQPNIVLEDMESYDPTDPNSLKANWSYIQEDGFGDQVRSVVADPNGMGQVLKIDYAFKPGNLHFHSTFTLHQRGVDLRLYDTLSFRIKKATGCELNKLIIDYYDARGIVAPVESDIYGRGRMNIDITEVPADVWTVVTGTISTDRETQSCTDLYQLQVSFEDGGADTGTVYIDSIELADGTTDCILTAGIMWSDLNGDCKVNLSDFALMAKDWLSGE